MEVIVLGFGNSVCISPGRQAHWIAVTELVLLENLERVVNGTFTKIRDGLTSVIAEPVWHNQIFNHQLGFLKGELFDVSQHSKEAGPNVSKRILFHNSSLLLQRKCTARRWSPMFYGEQGQDAMYTLSRYWCGPKPKVFWPHYDLCCWQQQRMYMYIIL